MYRMLVTLCTSHLDMSTLKDVAPWNMDVMMATLDTSQSDE